MYRELLDRVAREQERSGAGPQGPCPGRQLARLMRRVRRELGVALPIGYADLLAQVNGVDWNGVVIYASDTTPIVGRPARSIAGIVEVNLALRDDRRFEDLLVVGSDGMDIFAYRDSTDAYEVYDEVPHELIADALTFDALMTRVLTRSLR
jgi:hypothetical protein